MHTAQAITAIAVAVSLAIAAPYGHDGGRRFEARRPEVLTCQLATDARIDGYMVNCIFPVR